MLSLLPMGTFCYNENEDKFFLIVSETFMCRIVVLRDVGQYITGCGWFQLLCARCGFHLLFRKRNSLL